MRRYPIVIAFVPLLLCSLSVAQSNIGFQSTTYPGGIGPNALVKGDFNGDRQPDLVTADSCLTVSCVGSGAIQVLLGKRDGTFRDGGKYAAGASGESAIFVAAGDFNRDGALDVAVVNTGINLFGDVSVLLNNGDGSFQAPVAYAVGGAVPVWDAVGDFNGDQKPDIAVSITTTNSVAVLLGNGDGTFQPAINYPVESSPQGIALADVNGDGKLDVISANECGNDPACRIGTISVLLGNGDGTFRPELSFGAGLLPLALAVADFNRDAHPDLAIASPCGTDLTCGSGGAVGILLGNGDGTFQPIAYYPSTGSDTARLAVGEFNGDHRPDVVALNYQTADITVLIANADGTLQPGVDFAVGANPIAAVASDFNRDHSGDIAVVSQIPNTVTIFLNTGTGLVTR